MTHANLNIQFTPVDEQPISEANVVEFRTMDPLLPAILQTAGGMPTASVLPAGALPLTGDAPEPVIRDRPWWVVTDSDVFDARSSRDGMSALWEKVQGLIHYKIKEMCRKFSNLREDDLHQESWIVFDQAVIRYDGRRPDSFWTYLNLSLYTRFRQCGAHDRVIPIPHDTRRERRSWHKISQETFNARLNAQDPIFVDAMEGDGWESLQVSHDESENIIEEMDMAVLQDRYSKIPQRWADLLKLLTRYDEADVAEMLDLSLDEMQRKSAMVRQLFEVLPDGEFIKRRTEAQYEARLEKILKDRDAAVPRKGLGLADGRSADGRSASGSPASGSPASGKGVRS
ncbi:hypothetical protein JKG47_04260 [Acidithiobacillus sp. MC6.1]|nr:hypothetical protein [Acidithiobacillus sp. MC6.1]